ncbi:hypothetical protein ABFS82_09G069100 [Erythranthe guttata]
MQVKKCFIILVTALDVESAIGINLNPCTLPACKKALQDKYLSATCASAWVEIRSDLNRWINSSFFSLRSSSKLPHFEINICFP